MKFKQKYKCLNNNIFNHGKYKIVPLRFEDKLEIMKWRNEQMYHLRQTELLTEENQDNYFKNVVSKLFDKEQPDQILFSYLEDDKCIGYGGLVHINWVDKNAEISFIMSTDLEKEYFELHWAYYLHLIEKVAFDELNLYKIFTYAFDLRPHLYDVLEKVGYKNEAILKEHCFFDEKYIDVYIHEKRNNYVYLRKVTEKDVKLVFDWANDNTVRENSINKQKIEWKSHIEWFRTKIGDKNTKWFILEVNCEEVGQIRFDFDENSGFWLIGFSLDANYRGKGYGTLILKKSIKKLINHKFRALVQEENVASQRVFERLNFIKTNNLIDNHYFEYIYK